jgi:rubrerythrin
MISRRTFIGLSGAGLAGPAVLLGGCGSGEDASTDVSGSPEEDIDLLGTALELERSAAVAYERGAELLAGEALELAQQFAGQEREHADVLVDAIEKLGGTPAEELSDDDYAEQLGVGKLKSQEDVFTFGVDLENTEITTYNDAVAKLSTPEIRRTVYTIVANEAQHLTVLLGELGEPQVPDAFVTGTRL